MNKNISTQRTRHDFFYFQIATRYYLNYIKLEKEFLSKKNRSKMDDIRNKLSEFEGLKFTKAELNEIQEKFGVKNFTLDFFQLRTFGTISVVFSALCLEALINDYCVFKKSSAYLSNYVDKLDPVSKWKIFPELFTGKSIASEGKAFELLKGLYSFRNNLVHPKSKIVEPLDLDNQKNPLTKELLKFIERARQSLPTIKEATYELYGIDNSFNYLNEYEWLWTGNFEKLKNISDVESFYLSIINGTNFSK